MSELTILTTDKIYKLHPKIITIGVRNSRFERDLTTINLPITNDVYTLLIKNFGRGNISQYYPLVFIIDDKGVAINVRPYRLYEKEKAEAEAEAEQKSMPTTSSAVGDKTTPN